MIDTVLEGKEFRISSEIHQDIRPLFSNEDPRVRQAAIIMAAQTKISLFFDEIVAASVDRDANVANQALNLIQKEIRDFRPYLVRQLDSDDPVKRSNGITVLSRFDEKKLVPVFIRLFADDNEKVRNQASLAVHRLTSKNDPLLQAALEDENLRIKATAYQTIGHYRDIEDVPFFIAAFTSPYAELKKQAQIALLKQGEQALPFLHREALDRNNSVEARLAALNIIQGLKSLQSIKPMFPLLEDSEERIRLKIDVILSSYGANAIPILTDLYRQSENDRNRINVIEFVAATKAPEALPILTEALGDVSTEVVIMAIKSIQVYGQEAWPQLRETVLSGQVKSKVQAMYILRQQWDSWLVKKEDGEINNDGVYILISQSTIEELEEFLNNISLDLLLVEGVRFLREAWLLANDFAEIQDAIDSGDDPYLYIWRQQQKYATEARNNMRESFEVLHKYIVSRNSEVLEKARKLQAEGRKMEEKANEQLERLNRLSPAIKEQGRKNQKRYIELREQLVQIWGRVSIEMKEVTKAIFASYNLNPDTLSYESSLLIQGS